MRYPASEKLEIIRLVEESASPARRTLEKVGIPRATFYRWYYLYQAGGPVELLVLAGHLPRDAQENPNFRPVRQAQRRGLGQGAAMRLSAQNFTQRLRVENSCHLSSRRLDSH